MPQTRLCISLPKSCNDCQPSIYPSVLPRPVSRWQPNPKAAVGHRNAARHKVAASPISNSKKLKLKLKLSLQVPRGLRTEVVGDGELSSTSEGYDGVWKLSQTMCKQTTAARALFSKPTRILDENRALALVRVWPRSPPSKLSLFASGFAKCETVIAFGRLASRIAELWSPLDIYVRKIPHWHLHVLKTALTKCEAVTSERLG